MESGSELPAGSRVWRRAAVLLTGAERSIFALVSALFFVAAFALALRSVADVWSIIAGPRVAQIFAVTSFLDGMLLVLMMVELAYTVTLSLRGATLVVEPFLVVALIAVIRRLLVLTVGGVSPGAGGPASAATTTTVATLAEPAVLTAIIFVLVGSLVLVRWKRVGH